MIEEACAVRRFRQLISLWLGSLWADCNDVNVVYRRARALSYFVRSGEIIVFNFLTNRSFFCNLQCLDILAQSEDWQPLAHLFAITEKYRTSSITEEIVQLFSLTALVAEGDLIAGKDAEYDEGWEWGPATGLLHFSSQDNLTVDDQMAAEIQILRAKDDPSPPLIERQSASDSVAFPPFEIDSELKAVMRTRRTIRAFADEPVALSDVSDALFCGLGITHVVSTEVGDHPLRMTPSPGARNAFEGYIYVRNVPGLAANKFYHYSAFNHRLEPVNVMDPLPSMGEMFAENQPWVAKAGLIIFLVAHFERVMWKYINGNAYGHVFTEAGHIAQNMMLSMSKQGLVVNPAGAIAHSLIERAIGEDQVTHSVVYAMAAGHPDISDEYVRWLGPEFEIRDAFFSMIRDKEFTRGAA